MATVRNRQDMYAFKRSILAFIRQNPDTDAHTIVEQFGGNQGTVRWHLKIMARQGLLLRKKEGDSFLYRTLAGAAKKLKEEYTTPIQRTQSQPRKTKPKKKAAKLKLVASNGEPTPDIDVSTPMINITLGGREQQVDMKGAKTLFFKLKKIFEND